MKKQVFVIHGGDAYNSYREYIKALKEYSVDLKKLTTRRWKETLGEKLGGDYQVLLLNMPNGYNAKYEEWKIWFEKYIPFMTSPVRLLGHSLGGTFLVKYLSENRLPKKIAAVFLVAAPFDDKDADYSLASFRLKKNLDQLSEQGGQIYLYQSQDDDIVPFVDLEKYRQALPAANFRVFKDRGHFRGTNFPELIRDIKKSAVKK